MSVSWKLTWGFHLALLFLRLRIRLLYRRRTLLLAGWWDDALDPHVRDDVSVVLHVMANVDIEHSVLRQIISENLHRLDRRHVGHGVVHLVTISEAFF